MTRARTKVAEWWETSYDRERWNGQCPQRTRVGARTVARVNGGKVYHVTRYRLAPLVKLRWVVTAFAAAHHFDARDDKDSRQATVYGDGRWVLWMCRDSRSEGVAATVAEAKAACAARLLELGYRVREQ